ncbi:hypothetical protein HJG60_010427 [Phyllostomus discolor]|uniref:Centromere protein J C-terminal domain-containing protein n=1 Tax=Phyllostomus discolor TaxID=89673 RepID=A0A834EF09_9CHIR|nr:hypothetical protein HJG60_010427 [Phyllostomus discolor]
MLGAHLEAERPAHTSCPGDPQAGTDPGKTAERPREGGGGEELLRLQRQVAGLHQLLRRQEARWSAAFRHLQMQIDALRGQGRGPRGGPGAAELRAPGPGRTGSDTQSLPGEPESSQPTGTGTGTEGKGGEARSPDGKVGEAASAKGPGKDVGAETTVLHFLNGDTQRILPDQRVVRTCSPHVCASDNGRSRPVYYCAGAQTTRTTHPSGLQVLRFPDKRTEKLHPDGSRETLFPDGTVRRLSGGREETVFPDGTCVRVERNGDRTIVLSNGQRDIHTAQFRRREYPDGTVKTVYGGGLQETRFTSGRVRVRRDSGSLVLDQKQAAHHSQ